MLRAEANELRALRRLRLRYVRVEPDLVTVRIEDLECPVSPPLHRQRVADRDSLLLQSVVQAIDVVDFEVDFNGLLADCRPRSTGCPREHDPGLAQDDGTEIELPVLADHAHDMLESQPVHIEVPRIVHRSHRDDRHDPT